MRRIREIRNAKVIVSNVDRWPNIFARKLFWKEMSHHLAKDRLSGTLREFQQEALEIFQHALSLIKRRNISQWLIAGAIAQGEELSDGRIDWNNSAVDGSVAFAWVCQEREKKTFARGEGVIWLKFLQGFVSSIVVFLFAKLDQSIVLKAGWGCDE